MKVRVGVVGLGKMALLHGSILGSMEEAELVAFCEISPLVRRFAGRFLPAVRVVAGVEELAGLGLDAVYITTPARSHFPVLKQVYQAGIARHVFVEKPLATSFPEAAEAAALARVWGGVSMVGYNRRFSVTFAKAKQMLGEGVLGPPSSFEACAWSSDFCGARGGGKASARGGAIDDLGCHAVDLALWLFGPMDVTGAQVRSLLGGPAEDEAECSVVTPGGLKGEIRTSWCRPEHRMPEFEVVVQGPKGALRVNEDRVELSLAGRVSTWHRHDLGDAVPFFIGGSEYVREDCAFVQSILEGGVAEPGFDAASQVERITDAMKGMGGGVR